MLQEIQTYAPKAVSFVITHKDAILSLVGGAAGLSALSQVVLHKVNQKIDNVSEQKRKFYSYVLVQVLTAITAICTWAVSHANLEVLWPALSATVTAVHRFAVSPLYTAKILPYLQYEASIKESTATVPSEVETSEPSVPSDNSIAFVA